MLVIYALIVLCFFLGLIIYWMEEAEQGCERDGIGFTPCKVCDKKFTCKESEFYYEKEETPES